MSNFQGYVVRGLLSVWLTRGPEHLTAEINQRWPGSVAVSDHGTGFTWFSNVPWLIARSREIAKRKKKLALIGHSFGGTSVILVAQALARENIDIDLLCPIDPAYQYTTIVPHNVKRCVGFYQHTPGQLGQGEIRPASGWTRKEWSDETVDHHCYESHIAIVNDPYVHRTIIEELGKL